ncbi:uncharacterized protein LOC108744278 isoform X2 [Agrilus planipennis]|uniref:Uncharacterized protein LOC108744278 isoform X2 n=1 Tax=Agrilus planipennis TaxID=224129 RepID=A0A1W4XH74_AGRPL|nr:uncharacterized protein LOC108744278 isoform X2 [Agrilus planipennis]
MYKKHLYKRTSRYIGWAEYFGFVAPTLTKIYRHRETTTVMDPRTVVTFSVKGCRPTRLPLDLDRCAPEIKATTTQSAFPALHTLPSHGSEQEQSITDYIKGNSQFRHNDVKSQDVSDSLQASYPSYVQDEIVTQPTEPLPLRYNRVPMILHA